MRCPGCPQDSLSGKAEVFAEYCEGPVPLLPDETDRNTRQLACGALLLATVRSAGSPKDEIVHEYANAKSIELETEVVIDLRDDATEEDPLSWRIDEAIARAAQASVQEVYQHTA